MTTGTLDNSALDRERLFQDWIKALTIAKPWLEQEDIHLLLSHRLSIEDVGTRAVALSAGSIKLQENYPRFLEHERLEILLYAISRVINPSLHFAFDCCEFNAAKPSDRWRAITMHTQAETTLAVRASADVWPRCTVCGGPVCSDLLWQEPHRSVHPECFTYAKTVLLPSVRAAHRDAAERASAEIQVNTD